MKRDKSSLTSLKDIIADLIRGDSISFHLEDGRIWEIWDEAVGPEVSENARPLWVKDGHLRVAVSNPIWLQELRFREKEIKKRLNEKMKGNEVSRIDFRIYSK